MRAGSIRVASDQIDCIIRCRSMQGTSPVDSTHQSQALAASAFELSRKKHLILQLPPGPEGTGRLELGGNWSLSRTRGCSDDSIRSRRAPGHFKPQITRIFPVAGACDLVFKYAVSGLRLFPQSKVGRDIFVFVWSGLAVAVLCRP